MSKSTFAQCSLLLFLLTISPAILKILSEGTEDAGTAKKNWQPVINEGNNFHFSFTIQVA